MLEVVIEEEGRETRTIPVNRFPCRIGRGKDVEVVLSGWRVARVHVEIQRIGSAYKLVDQGTLIGTRVNGERIVEYGPLSEFDEILVAGFRLRVRGLDHDDSAQGYGSSHEPAPAHSADGVSLAGMPSARQKRVTGENTASLPASQHDASLRRAQTTSMKPAALPEAEISSILGAGAGAGTGAGTGAGAGAGTGAGTGADTGTGVGVAGHKTLGSVRAGEFGLKSPINAMPGDDARPDAMAWEARPESETADAQSALSGQAGALAAPPGLLRAAGDARSDEQARANEHACADEQARADGLAGAEKQGRSEVGTGAAEAADEIAQNPDGDEERLLLERYARDAQEQGRALGWRQLVHRQLLEVIDLRRSNLSQFSPDELRVEVRSAVERIVAELNTLPPDIDRSMLIRDTVDEAVGLGPLERLMSDSQISEIMVNSATDIFIERQGKLQRVPLAFSDDDAIRNVIERIVAPLGRRIDESSPLVDARLADGSRVNAIIPPVALKGPTITIRRFNRTVMTPETLVQNRSASPEMMAFLKIAVEQHKSIIVSGGTGSGKTTLLNVLSNLIPTGERLITIEDAAELKLVHPHLVSLESRPPNAEGRGAITIRDLVRNALRMRPDRIIVGECRGAEALDMMQAMNTGHEGSMTTVHANTPRDVLSRLEMLALMAGIELPLAALREQLASAVDLIIHQARFSDGSRRITSITEICGVESGKIQTQELFRFEQTGLKQNRIQGRFRACNEVPTFYEALRDRGIAVDLSIFEDREAALVA